MNRFFFVVIFLTLWIVQRFIRQVKIIIPIDGTVRRDFPFSADDKIRKKIEQN